MSERMCTLKWRVEANDLFDSPEADQYFMEDSSASYDLQFTTPAGNDYLSTLTVLYH